MRPIPILPVFLLAALSPVPAAVAQPARPRIVLAVDGIGQTRNLPILVAERQHYFTDAGLTVTLVDAPAEPGVDELLADGRTDGSVAFFHHTFMTQTEHGVATEAVIVMGASPQLKLVVADRLRGQVHGVVDLKGRRIFVGGGNSGKTTAMNWLAMRAGLAIGDYRALAPTTAAAMAAALRDGSADAVIAHEPDASYYQTSGAGFTLADLNSVEGTRRSLGDIYPSTALYLTRDYVAAHPAEVEKLVRACVRALAFINTHSADEIAAILPPKVVGPDRPGFVRMLADDKMAFATDGRIPPDAARRQLAVMTALAPKYAAVRLDDTFTNQFVEKALAR